MGIHEKFFLIEDDPEDARLAFDELKNAGHELIQYAGTFEDAIKRISNAKAHGMTVAIVDGNLDSYSGEDCEDGKEIAETIRAQAPGVTIVAHSRSEEKVATYGDIYVSKREPPGKLAEVVTAIPGNKK